MEEFFSWRWDILGLIFGGFARSIERGITSLFGSSNARYIKKLQPTVDAINALEPKYQAMTDAELKEQTAKFRKRLAAGETLPAADDDVAEDGLELEGIAGAAQLLRGDLGIVARYLNKPISFRITRYLLCHLPLTPNQVSVAAALVGLCGAALVATGRHWLMIAGFLLAHAQSVLDGCDGELARVRFQQSKVGEWLDTLIDEGLNIALFACTGIGLWRQSGSTLALAVGLTAASIHVFYDVVALTELARQGQGGELMRIRWWLTGGIDMKNRTGQKHGDLVVIVHGFTRRDFFVLAFFLYALAGLPFLALVHASIIAVGQLVLTSGQVAWRLTRSGGR